MPLKEYICTNMTGVCGWQKLVSSFQPETESVTVSYGVEMYFVCIENKILYQTNSTENKVNWQK